MIKSTPQVEAAVDRYSASPWDDEPAYQHLIRTAWEAGWRGNRELEQAVYTGLCMVEVFHVIRGGWVTDV